MTLSTLDLGNYGIIVFQGHAGFRVSTVATNQPPQALVSVFLLAALPAFFLVSFADLCKSPRWDLKRGLILTVVLGPARIPGQGEWRWGVGLQLGLHSIASRQPQQTFEGLLILGIIRAGTPVDRSSPSRY